MVEEQESRHHPAQFSPKATRACRRLPEDKAMAGDVKSGTTRKANGDDLHRSEAGIREEVPTWVAAIVRQEMAVVSGAGNWLESQDVVGIWWEAEGGQGSGRRASFRAFSLAGEGRHGGECRWPRQRWISQHLLASSSRSRTGTSFGRASGCFRRRRWKWRWRGSSARTAGRLPESLA